jgi:hypothetical protein
MPPIRDLELVAKPAGGITLRRPLVAVAALVSVLVLGGVGALTYVRWSKSRWAEKVALPQAAQLLERDQPLAALALMTQAEPYAPSSPELVRLKEDLHLWPLRVDTTPEGADIYAADYTDPKASDLSHWVHLGRTPLATSTLPASYFRLRAVRWVRAGGVGYRKFRRRRRSDGNAPPATAHEG